MSSDKSSGIESKEMPKEDSPEGNTNIHCSLTLPEQQLYPAIQERGFYSDVITQGSPLEKDVSPLNFTTCLLSSA